MPGYLIAEIKAKESKSGIILSETSEEGKEVIVKSVHKDCKNIKKGDSIIISPDSGAWGIKDDDGKELLVIPESGVCVIR